MSIDSTAIEIHEDLVIRIDGGHPVTTDTLAALGSVCDAAEDHGGPGLVLVHVSGAPDGTWPRDTDVALVSKWERALRRLERLSLTTVAVVTGECSGPALDALLATDYRIASPSVRLLMTSDTGATWPGMALYRMVRQAGVAWVRRAALFGITIDADEALKAHLIDQLADEPVAALSATPGLLTMLARPDLAVRRQLLLDAASVSFEEALGAHLAACDREIRRSSAEAVS
ncbi:enoyl-CoA-hydratase DpgB [Streptomyces albidoflavus]